MTSGSTGIFDVTFTSLSTANYIRSINVQTNLGSDDYTVAYYNRTTTGFCKEIPNGSLDGGASGNFNRGNTVIGKQMANRISSSK